MGPGDPSVLISFQEIGHKRGSTSSNPGEGPYGIFQCCNALEHSHLNLHLHQARAFPSTEFRI